MTKFVVGVPFSDCEKYIGDNYLIATREDEAVAIAVGAWFTGKEPLVFMQDSGFGNCVNIITSLLKPYDININFLVNVRTTPEHHAFMGKKFKQLTEVLEIADSIKCC